MSSVKKNFSATQVKEIQSAIQSAEENTSGEIRVHVENRCRTDVLERARNIFNKLGMYRTKHRNGVLFHLAVVDRKFAIVGDEGIHKNVPEGFWEEVRDRMQKRFEKKEFTEGLCMGIEMTGKELKKYFSHSLSDRNELSNEVTFDEK